MTPPTPNAVHLDGNRWGIPHRDRRVIPPGSKWKGTLIVVEVPPTTYTLTIEGPNGRTVTVQLPEAGVEEWSHAWQPDWRGRTMSHLPFDQMAGLLADACREVRS